MTKTVPWWDPEWNEDFSGTAWPDCMGLNGSQGGNVWGCVDTMRCWHTQMSISSPLPLFSWDSDQALLIVRFISSSPSVYIFFNIVMRPSLGSAFSSKLGFLRHTG